MTVEERLDLIEKKLAELDMRTSSMIHLGPRPPDEKELAGDVDRIMKSLIGNPSC